MHEGTLVTKSNVERRSTWGLRLRGCGTERPEAKVDTFEGHQGLVAADYRMFVLMQDDSSETNEE